MTSIELQAAKFRLNAERPLASDEEYEWDWITLQLDEDDATDYASLKSAIEREYAGRGVAFEVPSIEKIHEGLNALLEANVVTAE